MIKFELKPMSNMPEIFVSEANGYVEIKGSSLMVEPEKFYRNFIHLFSMLRCRNIKVSIQFDYVNSKSSQSILTLLQSLYNNSRIKKLELNWEIDEDDTAMVEMAVLFKSLLQEMKPDSKYCIFRIKKMKLAS